MTSLGINKKLKSYNKSNYLPSFTEKELHVKIYYKNLPYSLLSF
jgi:hypothetical protein